MNRTCRVRLGLVAVMSLLALLVMIQPGHSQPPRGGIIGGPPGGFPGAQPPGIPNFPQPPQIPQPPNTPRPPGFGGGFGIRGGGIGGGQTEWRCGRCGTVLATGPTPPAQAVCPRCQATNVPPGTPRFPGFGGAAPPGGTPPQIGPPAVPPQGGGLPQPIVPQPGLPQDGLPQDGMMQVQPIVEPAAPPVNVYVPPNSSNSSSSNSRGSVAWVVIVTLGVLLLLGVGIAGVVFALMKNQPAKKRQRPRRRYEDDDDY